MRELAGDRPLDMASWEAVPPSLRTLIDPGWVIEADGACLLVALRDGYHGSRAVFADATGFEASVNGLGIPDRDLGAEAGERTRDLFVRAVSYAAFALTRAESTTATGGLTAVVSLSNSLEEEPGVTARVTFFLERDDEPSLVEDVDAYREEALLVFRRSDL
ncbi:hypothetical protein GCM10011578_064350 [Streptomyces fuscichromogenes]|uniref:Uncharacterized protein n=2 Tax=Streptomyces fuscichromogenes TaxID=1324013 RepID=A0A918CUJ2_9ACTN|nr:hypothetical protein GCM10011578_064350 [Streptomyces fuscichromogenes]